MVTPHPPALLDRAHANLTAKYEPINCPTGVKTNAKMATCVLYIHKCAGKRKKEKLPHAQAVSTPPRQGDKKPVLFVPYPAKPQAGTAQGPN